jgi:hypothetical protein
MAPVEIVGMHAMMHVTRRAIPRAMTLATRHAIRPATLPPRHSACVSGGGTDETAGS